MSANEFKSILNTLLSSSFTSVPLDSKIQISMNGSKKSFCLKMRIFKPYGMMPKSVEEYVFKRKNHTFKPHATSFSQKDGEIFLIQEIPWEGQSSFRQFFLDFSIMAKKCHQMLKEIASEEKPTKFLSFGSNCY